MARIGGRGHVSDYGLWRCIGHGNERHAIHDRDGFEVAAGRRRGVVGESAATSAPAGLRWPAGTARFLPTRCPRGHASSTPFWLVATGRTFLAARQTPDARPSPSVQAPPAIARDDIAERPSDEHFRQRDARADARAFAARLESNAAVDTPGFTVALRARAPTSRTTWGTRERQIHRRTRCGARLTCDTSTSNVASPFDQPPDPGHPPNRPATNETRRAAQSSALAPTHRGPSASTLVEIAGTRTRPRIRRAVGQPRSQRRSKAGSCALKLTSRDRSTSTVPPDGKLVRGEGQALRAVRASLARERERHQLRAGWTR